jgi:tRNA(Ile)-lysidine synthase TilS/MesJ
MTHWHTPEQHEDKDIRELLLEGHPVRVISKVFGVSEQHVRRLRKRLVSNASRGKCVICDMESKVLINGLCVKCAAERHIELKNQEKQQEAERRTLRSG